MKTKFIFSIVTAFCICWVPSCKEEGAQETQADQYHRQVVKSDRTELIERRRPTGENRTLTSVDAIRLNRFTEFLNHFPDTESGRYSYAEQLEAGLIDIKISDLQLIIDQFGTEYLIDFIRRADRLGAATNEGVGMLCHGLLKDALDKGDKEWIKMHSMLSGMVEFRIIQHASDSELFLKVITESDSPLRDYMYDVLISEENGMHRLSVDDFIERLDPSQNRISILIDFMLEDLRYKEFIVNSLKSYSSNRDNYRSATQEERMLLKKFLEENGYQEFADGIVLDEAIENNN